jgi:hypothetical protein
MNLLLCNTQATKKDDEICFIYAPKEWIYPPLVALGHVGIATRRSRAGGRRPGSAALESPLDSTQRRAQDRGVVARRTTLRTGTVEQLQMDPASGNANVFEILCFRSVLLHV